MRKVIIMVVMMVVMVIMVIRYIEGPKWRTHRYNVRSFQFSLYISVCNMRFSSFFWPKLHLWYSHWQMKSNASMLARCWMLCSSWVLPGVKQRCSPLVVDGQFKGLGLQLRRAWPRWTGLDLGFCCGISCHPVGVVWLILIRYHQQWKDEIRSWQEEAWYVSMLPVSRYSREDSQWFHSLCQGRNPDVQRLSTELGLCWTETLEPRSARWGTWASRAACSSQIYWWFWRVYLNYYYLKGGL